MKMDESGNTKNKWSLYLHQFRLNTAVSPVSSLMPLAVHVPIKGRKKVQEA
jgi:hypothetical protein